ncbi:MAG: glycoside hydrolase family 95 protein, partial [Spirochaetia bacterium]|nr:glycoside hydrolase family 95 protein [Spirochaetia bacterium]
MDPLQLWYDRPASNWNEALPLGNGRLGAMVFGGAANERIQLNEDTLWSGGPTQGNNPEAKKILPKVREAVFSGRYAEATELIKGMQGPYTEAYMPMADLRIEFPGQQNISSYKRELDLRNAVSKVSYECGGAVFRREVIASHPDNLIAIHLSGSKPGSLTFTANLSSKLHFKIDGDSKTLRLEGKAPSHSLPSYLKSPEPNVYNDK